jgi:hypothetical protein
MSPENAGSAEVLERVVRLERSRERWRAATVGAIALAGVCLVLSSRSLTQVKAEDEAAQVRLIAQKQARSAPLPAAEAAAGYEYRQSVVLLNRVDVTLNEWAEKGWEPFSMVYVPPSIGAGGPGQVAIAMRRVARPR